MLGVAVARCLVSRMPNQIATIGSLTQRLPVQNKFGGQVVSLGRKDAFEARLVESIDRLGPKALPMKSGFEAT